MARSPSEVDPAYQLPTNPEWSSFNRTLARSEIANLGRLSERAGPAVERAELAAAGTAERGTNEARMRKTAAEAAASRLMASKVESGELKDRPMTETLAKNERTRLITAAAQRAESEGERTLPGSGWYFEHGKGILDVAESAGVEEPTSQHRAAQVLASSTVLSPLTDPESERKAFGGVASLRHEAGTAEEVVGGVEAGSGHPMLLSMGGDKPGSLRMIRGETMPHEELNPGTAPKVTAYTTGTVNAVGSHYRIQDRRAESRNAADEPINYDVQSPVEQEYRMRAGMVQEHLANPSGGYQQTLDFGLRSSDEGILSGSHPTAEDTWMQSVSTGQRVEPFPEAHRTSPAKFLASTKEWSSADTLRKAPQGTAAGAPKLHPDADVSAVAAMHAFNETATRAAASDLSEKVGFTVPSVLMQETVWTEQRRQAGADAPYNQAKAAEVKTAKAETRQAAQDAKPVDRPLPGMGPAYQKRAGAEAEEVGAVRAKEHAKMMNRRGSRRS